MQLTSLVWYKSDLRLADHEPLVRALQKGAVLPVYVFDPRHFAATKFGFTKTGSFRASFLLQAVTDLRQRLRQKGADLIVRIGQPEQIIPELAAATNASNVYCSEEVTYEELAVMGGVEKVLSLQNIRLHAYWTATLYHKEDIPWPLHRLPEVFTSFRKELEAEATVREPFTEPDSIPYPRVIDAGELPSVTQLGLCTPVADERAAFTVAGGETAAHQRLNEYLWEKKLLHHYKQTRDSLLGADYSSKLSASLALGCISPRLIYWQVKRYEREVVQNDSTYWLIFELMWRDYFRFIARKHGSKIFSAAGLYGSTPGWRHDKHLFKQWCEGNTGVAFVDANMRELQLTGFMSNRGRQNVASYLAKDLKIDWRWGASWFESCLADYDPCSNWLNWAYVAGVGNDPRQDRYFNIASQAKRYDPDGAYQRLWLQSQPARS